MGECSVKSNGSTEGHSPKHCGANAQRRHQSREVIAVPMLADRE
jgi:hypothetical protein